MSNPFEGDGTIVPEGQRPVNPSAAEPRATAGEPRDSEPRQGTAQSSTGELTQSLQEDVQTLGQLAKDQTRQVKEAAGKLAADQKGFAASKVSGVAAAISKVGEELEQGDQPEVGRYARQIGDSLQNFAGEIKDRDLGEIAHMAEDFGRRQPLAFLGMAALAGLVTSRFVMASSRRHPRRTAPTGTTSDRQGAQAQEGMYNG